MQRTQGLEGQSHPTSSCPDPSKGCSRSCQWCWQSSCRRCHQRPMRNQRPPKSGWQFPWTPHSSSWCWWCWCREPGHHRRSQALRSSRTQRLSRSRPRQLRLRSQHLRSELGCPLLWQVAGINYDTGHSGKVASKDVLMTSAPVQHKEPFWMTLGKHNLSIPVPEHTGEKTGTTVKTILHSNVLWKLHQWYAKNILSALYRFIQTPSEWDHNPSLAVKLSPPQQETRKRPMLAKISDIESLNIYKLYTNN